ncbi:16S ribosomal RNA methyltransferase KsgA Dim1 family protein [Secundilactobacillus odoratitofui DSM 19909 = JCM 15043]|uniref:Ribosomal RNA small subunit methyltransferase A n=1 Tax=Secundilactobacillus odoratitofui DSM 19909 = JCM 15043 TaxID=1423776 RepID=A0A0R1LUX9_9LACO|nr:16S rRNA (adenine(1518)-N(6)/adenine(1519)-N(6))-dimethyltransferase RsmA [Secundilactobacillus odoratitofui]KRK99192.1 16S ribosomal RNA methyltransferase KsgA Dim1 family protein [Secundilactobacillus odoratitofui DSM 19909 = JCM 15043]
MSKTPLIASPARTQAIINRYGLNIKKSLGQNFLTDINILEHIVQAADLSPKDNVIEIGPGIGALTEFLAQNAHQVLAFEIDDQLVPILGETLAQYDNITVINQDILQANLPQLIAEHFEPDRPLKLVANLPYYITTPILMNVLQSGLHFDAITVMMQKEVADRLVAVPGTKAYGSLSIAVQYQTEAKVSFTVPRTAFIPQPNVDSAIVTMTKREPFNPAPFDEKAFTKFVKGSFLHRRKSFWNNLLAMFGKDSDVKTRLTNVLERVRISPSIRSEKLTIPQFIELVNALHEEGLL